MHTRALNHLRPIWEGPGVPSGTLLAPVLRDHAPAPRPEGLSRTLGLVLVMTLALLALAAGLAAPSPARAATVGAGSEPFAVAVDPVTDKVYVANYRSDDVTVIDGTGATSTTIKTSAMTARIGSIPILAGAVTPTDIVGNIIVVYVMKPGSSRWSYSSNRTVYAAGTGAAWQYKYTFKKGMTKGVYKFKAVVPAGNGFLASTSPTTVSIKLK